VKLSVREAAERDILRQFEWYAERGLTDVARRFRFAVKSRVDELLATPQAGAPKSVANVELEGLRTWSVQGFDEFRIYYLVRDELIKIIPDLLISDGCDWSGAIAKLFAKSMRPTRKAG